MNKSVIGFSLLLVSCASAKWGHKGQTRTDQLELLAKNGELVRHYDVSDKETIAIQKQGYKVIKWSLKDYTNERTNMYGGKIGTEERTMAQQLYVVDTNIGTCFSGQGVELDCAAVKRDQDLSGYIK